jgi:c(7)-type cytochrome triheme protein
VPLIRQITKSTKRRRNPSRFLLFFSLVLVWWVTVVSCSTSTRQLFFDVPPTSEQELAEQARQEREATLAAAPDQPVDTKSLSFGAADDTRPRPAIESVTDWEQALELLPKDYKKGADWAAALEQGLVRPRIGADPRAQYAAAFQYDFIMEAEKPKYEAWFPHSAHTGWLGCKNCHMAIYPYKRNPATMKEMRKGASCGTCHGKRNVAFPLSNCKRCHLNL